MRMNYLPALVEFSKIVLITLFFSLPAHAEAIVFQPPLVVDQTYINKNGNVITGNYQGTLSQAAITIKTPASVIIANSMLQGPGDMIQALNVPANITVKNTIGIGTNPNTPNVQKGMFLHVNSFANINMQNNNIVGLRIGFYCSSYAGNKTSSNTLVIDKNVFTNVDARPSLGPGLYATTGQYNGQAVHTCNMFGVPGIEIGWNQVMNTANQSSTGALIEVNESSGTSASPMLIHDNFISGAFPTFPGKDLYAFGGILINGEPSDTAATASSFINITNNIVVATANYGITIGAGHNITAANNRVVSSGFLPNGTTFYPMSNYGNAFGAVNSNLYKQASSVFFNNSVTNNVLGLIKNNGSNAPIRSDWSLPGQAGAVAGNTNYIPNDNADPTVYAESQEFANWHQALKLSKITIGTATAGYIPDLVPLTPMPPVNFSASGPYTLDHVSITNPSGDCINVAGGPLITITNSVIGPCGGRGIHVASATQAVIQNNYVHDIVSQGISVEVVNSQSVHGNTVENAGSGIYLANNNSNVTLANVDYNQLINIIGMTTQATSAIQFNQISGPNNSVRCNVLVEPTTLPSGFQGPCDSFSLYLSSGTAASPIQMVGNRLNGGGDFWNCGGMMLTDGDMGPGTSGPGYVLAQDNFLLNAGNYGIDVSTGHDITINDNYVYGDNYNFYNPANDTYGPGRIGINTFNVYSSSCSNITVTNNTVFFLSSINGSVLNYGLNTNACHPTFQSNNIGYSIGQPFQFPSIYTPRPSC